MLSSAEEMYRTALNYSILVTRTVNGQFCQQVAIEKEKKKIVPVQLVFKNNLSVSNWYYGSSSQLKYTVILREMSKKHNLTSCPLNKPFVRPNQNICFNCPSNAIYNLGTQTC